MAMGFPLGGSAVAIERHLLKFINQKQYKGKKYAQQYAGGNGEIKRETLSFNMDISRHFANGKAFSEMKNKTHNHQDNSHSNKYFSHVFIIFHFHATF